MTIIIYITTIISNLILGIRTKRNLGIYYLSLISIILLILGYRNYSGYSNDLINYETEYHNLLLGFTSSYEIGYVLLMKIGLRFTNDFYVFRDIISLILILVLFKTFLKSNINPHLIIGFFSIYLIIMSAEQFRYFIGFTIFSIGILRYVFYKKKSKVSLIFFILIASSMHISFLAYFVLFLINFKSIKIKREVFYGFFSIILIIIVFINGNKIPGVENIIKYFESDKLTIYINQSTKLGFLYILVLHLFNVFISYWSYKSSLNTLNEGIIKKSTTILKINLTMLLLMPLVMTQITFYRLFRNLLILNYASYSLHVHNKNVSKINRLTFLICAILSTLCWLYFDLIVKTPSNALLIPFFEDNIFLKFFN